MRSATMPADHYPVLIALGVALALGGVIVGLSALVGSRSGGRIKLSPYESGAPLLDRSHKRISILFFLIAIDFVIFDVEAAFLYPWVLVLREGGWPLFGAVGVFLALVLVGLAYIWQKGGLDLNPRRQPQPGLAPPGLAPPGPSPAGSSPASLSAAGLAPVSSSD